MVKILVVLFLTVFVLLTFFIFNKLDSVSPKSLYSRHGSGGEIPPTWNLDWQGGPGFDRYKILSERGPYNTRLTDVSDKQPYTY